MYPPHKDITASVDAAVIREIRKHGYLFGGDRHEDYCPVLNDGTYAEYSWRGWGRIIALAYGAEGECSYMCGYMDSFIKPSARKYPGADSLPDDERIVPKESLADVFEMHLSDDMFSKVEAGTKTVEMRLFDDKRKQVDIGDYIEFIHVADPARRVLRKVADLQPFASFRDAFTATEYRDNAFVNVLRYTPAQLGAPESSDIPALVHGMYKYYTKKQEKEHGVIAFTLEKPEHTCDIRLELGMYSPASNGLLEEKFDDFDAYLRFEDAYYDIDAIEEKLSKVSQNFVRRYGSFVYNQSVAYDGDVNVMLRRMLKDILDKAPMLREIREKFCKAIALKVYAVTARDGKEPIQRLSLDDDIEEFLQTSGVELTIERRTI